MGRGVPGARGVVATQRCAKLLAHPRHQQLPEAMRQMWRYDASAPVLPFDRSGQFRHSDGGKGATFGLVGCIVEWLAGHLSGWLLYTDSWLAGWLVGWWDDLLTSWLDCVACRAPGVRAVQRSHDLKGAQIFEIVDSTWSARRPRKHKTSV